MNELITFEVLLAVLQNVSEEIKRSTVNCWKKDSNYIFFWLTRILHTLLSQISIQVIF